jgi:hypothetical protein
MTWLKDNRPFEDRLADRVLISSHENNSRFMLEVQHCRESDSGVYTARATNSIGSATCTAQLVVQECKYGNIFKPHSSRNGSVICFLKVFAVLMSLGEGETGTNHWGLTA